MTEEEENAFWAATAWLATPYVFSRTTGVRGDSSSCGGFVVGCLGELGINVAMNGTTGTQNRTTNAMWTATGPGSGSIAFDLTSSNPNQRETILPSQIELMNVIYYDLSMDGCVDHAAFLYGLNKDGEYFVINNCRQELTITKFDTFVTGRYPGNSIIGVKDYLTTN